jgi:hypothetical protein
MYFCADASTTDALIIVAFVVNLETGKYEFSFFLFSMIVLSVLGPWYFCEFLSQLVHFCKRGVGIFVGVALNYPFTVFLCREKCKDILSF